ncbi:hypothetical protein MMC07_000188 [Pseudocyphellaria aurata]|nr:hypothetical protein [Pseudocyphellaria aurata]
MLKSTYRPLGGPQPLPPGWTEHRAPTGHSYYYNATTKESTYNRPSQPEVQQQHVASSSQVQPQAGSYSSEYPNMTAVGFGVPEQHSLQGNMYGGRGSRGRGYTDRQRPSQDRPKSKHEIPGCTPWLLIKTKLGRRFVYNPEQGESYWKFPLDVMKGVVEYDRLEREKKMLSERQDDVELESGFGAAIAELPATRFVEAESIPSAARAPVAPEDNIRQKDDDNEEYEEVEVTDDEDEENPSKRQKIGDGDLDQPVEFNEDDIAYQLAAMGQDYGLDPGEYGVDQEEDLEEGAEGLALTEEDANGLFKDMLDDHHISPYATWEKIIEAGHIVDDERYLVLPNMKSRREIWSAWSRDRIQLLKERREHEEKQDPRISYFSFLQSHASPKLYWPEFRRKYKQEPALRDAKLSDKYREKAYRDYVHRLKLSESTLKADLVTLLKSIPLHILNRSTAPDALPPIMLTDLRYISLRSSIRDPLIETHISTLPLAQSSSDLDLSPEEQASLSKQKLDRERREQALAERQKQVHEQKLRQEGVLQVSKGMLRNGEEVLEQAMRVGKDGLRAYMEVED